MTTPGPGPVLVLASDSDAQFSRKLEGGACTLEGMGQQLELAESTLFGKRDPDSAGHSPSFSATSSSNVQRHCHQAEDSSQLGRLLEPQHIHVSGLSLHSDGGVLVAETLTDISPCPGPPPAPPEYDHSQPFARPPTHVTSDHETDPRENSLAAPLIPVAAEFEDGLIPIEELVGAITSPTPETYAYAEHPQLSDLGYAMPASAPNSSPLFSPGTLTNRRPGPGMIAPSPEEDTIFQGTVKITDCNEDGVLIVWQSQLSSDYRIHWHTKSGRETMWMRCSTAKIVPVYAQSHSSSLQVYLRDANGTHTPTFEFNAADDLFRFQSSLTGERVVLDVSCAKWIRASKPKGGSPAQTYAGIRVQLWHENRKTTAAIAVTASCRRVSSDSRFSTASTDGGLLGPRKDRLVPQQSRLVVYLGKLGGFIKLPITDDVEVEDVSPTLVKLRARKQAGFRRRGSQPGIRACIVHATADGNWGLPFHDITIDNTEEYEYYRSFELEFETEGSKSELLAVWDEIIQLRRQQRAKIEKIHEEMGRQTFTAKQAIRQWF